jgi:hypothetical protein
MAVGQVIRLDYVQKQAAHSLVCFTTMTTFVKANCHCGLNAFNIPFSTASLPIANDLCHCNSCRHCTGQLAVNCVRFDGIPLSVATNQPDDLKHLTPYKTFGAVRYFCSKCSAHIFFQPTTEPERWPIAVGLLANVTGIVQSAYHIWIEDTLDGGLARYLTTIDGMELPRYARGERDPETLPVDWRADKQRDARDQHHLSAYCHCKAIRLSITRPSARSALPSSPYPDALFPYHATHPSKVRNPDDEKWWLRPLGSNNPTHYLAGHCACTSCRLTGGFEIQSWAVIPRVNILVHSDSTTSPIELNLVNENLRPKGLRHYPSSPGRNREFCAICGATVFWWGVERPDLVDVSVGLLDSSQGALAEDWLEWHKERVSFSEEAISEPLVEALEHGLRISHD